MSAKTSLSLVVLFEEELREASRLLRVAGELPNGKEQAQAWMDALKACRVALWGLENKALVLITRKAALEAAGPKDVAYLSEEDEA